MMKSTFYILVVFALCGNMLSAQVSGNIKVKNVHLNTCRIDVDSLSIVPNSLSIESSSQEILDGFIVQNTQLLLSDSLCQSLIGKNITLTYRTFSFDIEQSYFHLDSTQMGFKDRAIYIGSDYDFGTPKSEIIDSKGLDYNGSFSRGFSVGNSQSLVLNSNFNLQLAGDLGNGIGIVAAISDDNIPIQPEGNTQLIQEFDRVFIKLSKDKSSVIAGDYNLERPKSHHINYFKKLKGLSATNISTFGKNGTLSSNASFAVSRGKFARQLLDVSEGNQGPYKLTGANGERFLIVLSGSEKVYLDGLLLERGLDYDYIIDYNRAEITFTPLRLIARESRIIVEYEYRDQNYLRSVYAANTYFSSPKYDLNFNFYNEQDSKTATGDIVLDSMDINLLSSIGDNLENAQISSIRQLLDTSFAARQVRYRLNPDVIPGDIDDVFLEYSANMTEDLYVATFTEVGEGLGRYVIDDNSIVNGRVYKYVGPNNGLYEPITKLTPPEKKQMMAFGAEVRPFKDMNIFSELSISNTDVNRFSSLGNDNNIGLAGVLKYNQNFKLGSTKKYKLSTQNSYEYQDENFNFLNPFRNAEFSRDWNINTQKIVGTQNLVKSNVSLSFKDSITTGYAISLFDVQGAYTGMNQRGSLDATIGGFKVKSSIDLLDSEGYGEKTSFLRPRLDASQILHRGEGLRIGIIYDGEKNERRNINTSSSLLLNSFAFDTYRAYIGNANDKKLHYKLTLSQRKDLFPEEDVLVKSISTNEVNTTFRWGISPSHSLGFNFGFRDFEVLRNELSPTPISSKKTIIGKVDHNISGLKGMLISSTNYLINSGQEPKVEFFFERVEVGQGDYIYVGNPDSVLINANFRYAPDLGTGNYIRLSLINNEFITTNNQELAQSLRIEPKKLLASKSNRWSKTLSRLSTISTFRISKKVEDKGDGQNATFLNFSSSDPNLVSYTSLISNTLFINRGRPEYDLQFGHKNSENIFTQISGLESRKIEEFFSRTRMKILSSSDFIFNIKKGNRGYNSEVFASRNLDIDYYSINPEISYRPGSNLRFSILYTYDQRKQQINQQETANSHDFSLNATIRQASNSNINIILSYVNVKFDGKEDSIIEFDMLQGLKDGKNFLWNTLFTKRLANNIDLNLSYEGRKTGTAPTVHIARAQVKATF